MPLRPFQRQASICSTSRPNSCAIFLSKVGEMSRPLWKGTVVTRPSAWRRRDALERF